MIPSTTRSARMPSGKSVAHRRREPKALFEKVHRERRPREDRLKYCQENQDEDRETEDFVRQHAIDLLRDPMLALVVVPNRILNGV